MEKDHKGYRIATGIINIVFSVCWFASVMILLFGTAREITVSNVLLLAACTLFMLPAGILHLLAKNRKKLLIVAGVILLAGAILNFLVTESFTFTVIYAFIIGMNDIMFGKEK